MPAWCGSDESPPFGSPTPAFLLYPHVAERECKREISPVSSYKITYTVMRAHLHEKITLQRTHFHSHHIGV